MGHLTATGAQWFSELLGPARDLDVQIAYFTEESAELDNRDRKLLAQFISHLRTQRKAVQQMMLGELSSARYLELIRRLQQAAQTPSVIESSLTVRRLAKREFKKLRKAINRLSASPSDVALHKIRIKAKRARYAAELARSSVGNPLLVLSSPHERSKIDWASIRTRSKQNVTSGSF